MLWYSKSQQSNGQESYAHLQISQQILLGKFAEPKRRYLAQSCYFDIKFEPSWLTVKICTNGKRSSFRYRAAEEFAEISVFENRLFLCPTVCVLHRNKQGLCVPKSQSKSTPKGGFTL